METGAQLTERLVSRMGSEEENEASRKPYDISQHFWLAYPPKSDDFAAEVVNRFSNFATRWREGSSPISHAIMESYRMYHGLQEYDTSPVVDLQTGGEHDEFLRLFINEYRGLVRHQNSLMTTERPAWDVQARTSGSKAAKQVTLARNLLDWLMGAKGYEKVFSDGAEFMRILGASFIAQGWNPNGGHKGLGDIWRTVLAPWECAHEDVREYGDTTWWIFVRWESRWDWVAHFAKDNPKLAERLSNHSPSDDIMCGLFKSEGDDNNDADRIPLLYVYANPSRACPLGRVAVVAGAEGGLVLQDGPSPYGEAPIRRMCAAEFLGTSIPYGNSWTMLPIQKAYDVCWSAIISRIDMFAIPNVATQDGMEFEAGDIAGANSLKVPPGADLPQVVDLLTVPSPLPSTIEALGQRAEAASGINSVTRGQPTENITSGSMAALIASQAQQFNSADERAYVTTMEAVGTDALRIYQKCATEPQLISIVGQDERYSTREFKAEDLELVQRVAIKVGNALSRNIAGRTEIANHLLERQMIQDPREYLQVLKTGELSPIFSGPSHELENIKSENEMMVRGQAPIVSPWDNDELHIREHKCELDTDARYDQRLSALINKHLGEHMQSWQRKSLEAPDMLAAIGQNPLPGAQAAAAQAASMQGNQAPPQQPGSPPVKTPHAAEPPKSQPGPAPQQPKGQEPSTITPSLPQPAEAPPEVQS
jgi:hypothetical protein